MLGKQSSEKVYCGVDVGSRNIKSGLIRIKDNQEIEVLGIFQTPTQGFCNSTVSDLAELSECISSCITELTKRVNVKLQEVQLGINGGLVDARISNTMIPLMDRGHKVIASRDLKKVNEQAKLLGVKMEEEILHHLPQMYQIDDDSFAVNPLGLYGRKLGVNSLMLVSDINCTKNVIKAVNQAGYDVDNLFFSSYAAADVICDEEQKKKGTVLIDIGCNITSILIFKDGMLKQIDKIYCGGDNFTKAISDELNLSFDLAEEIKKSYAMATSTESYQDEEILVKRENKYIPIKKNVICSSIQPSINQFVDEIKAILDHSKYHHQVNDGVNVIGGGSLLPGLMERIEERTNLPVHLGQIKLPMNKRINNAAVFSSVIGLAQKGYQQSSKDRFVESNPLNWRANVVSKVRELYNEYF